MIINRQIFYPLYFALQAAAAPFLGVSVCVRGPSIAVKVALGTFIFLGPWLTYIQLKHTIENPTKLCVLVTIIYELIILWSILCSTYEFGFVECHVI